MDAEGIIHKVIAEAGGVARTADFNATGIPNYTVADWCKRGLIARLRNGYYSLPEQGEQREEVLIARLFPDGIICMDSALFHYGYSDKTPLEWHMSFPRSVTRSRFENVYPPVRCYMVQPSLLEYGKTSGDWFGVTLSVYDRERTICDCFKHRAQMDSEMFAKALNAYAADDKKNLAKLSAYAKKMRVHRSATEIMGVLLNG